MNKINLKINESENEMIVIFNSVAKEMKNERN